MMPSPWTDTDSGETISAQAADKNVVYVLLRLVWQPNVLLV